VWTRFATAGATAAILTLIVSSVAACGGSTGSADRTRPGPPDPAALVNPLIGTADGGDVFPGPDLPFGMVQWSPDTTHPPEGGGYSASSTAVTGFSLTHMSGPGCKSAGDVPVLPTLGAVRPAARDSFSHARQSATAGYYSVGLANGIGVQLTATTRTGLAEFSFPPRRSGNLIFKLNGSQNGDSAVTFRLDSPTQVQGSVRSRDMSCGDPRPYRLFFDMRFSRPARSHGTFGSATRAGAVLHPRARTLSVASRGRVKQNLAGPVGAYVRFAAGPPVLAKVGISYVSAANAAANLAAEDPGWSFSAIRAAAEARWNALLSKIAVTGGSHSERVVFYTALYHSLLAPSTFSDDNGQYAGADGRVHAIGTGQAAEYTNFSGWDIYRTQAQLEALLDPAAASGAAQSMLSAYEQTGMLPKWQAYGRETYVTVGDPADAILADYYAFGARGFDVSAALSAMTEQATTPGNVRPGLSYLENLGYLPENGSFGCCNFQASVATTLEYDTDDFAISALAGALGDTADQAEFRTRAHDWHNLLNSSSGLMQPRLVSGGWSPSFSPNSGTGFFEGDSWQYTGMVPFDVAGLAAAKGGRDAMISYLSMVLAGFRRGDNGSVANMSNEPSIELPWEYDYVGRPYDTQRTVRRIQDELWRNAPGGIPGNDDFGAASAWFVWSALGMYPMTPGTATLALGSPLFSRAVIELPSGASLQIIGSGAGPSRPYVRSATWNSARWTRAYAPAAAITSGGTLDFQLGSSPDRRWAASPADAPPSYGA
jgi:predicted alpha-1,2-mannosidase